MIAWGDLPQELTVNGTEYAINADFRDILDILVRLNDPEQDTAISAYVSLALFFEDFGAMPESDYEEAARVMLQFINGGDPVEEGDEQFPKTIDWQQDRQLIIADTNKVAGREIREMEFCHWWTFLGWFGGIGEGQLATVVSIREKLRKHKKLEDWEREFYKRNRSKVDFKQTVTAGEEEIFDAWRT